MIWQLCGLWSPFFWIIGLRGLETSGINNLVTERHISEEQRPEVHCCEDLKKSHMIVACKYEGKAGLFNQ
jgi:hypothetical protein